MKHHGGQKSSSSIQWRLTQYCRDISVDVSTLQLVPCHPTNTVYCNTKLIQLHEIYVDVLATKIHQFNHVLNYIYVV